ncbi:TAXI family TRAP transporter solute-binding subunit [Rhizobiales bacterium RZME27]|uniref:TAXI family TRAP transporter solute-binding subunit n=1 Tax=Endobacterium cereale TaxID=2663029 RepID=A0A6A8A143_9HYPH|nr:TAXI family TRAP transporter solute-binding subunit [Endobacterium cereale]MEB2843443.1 TAXI family TRAP transporter solute-binding subunit [Endobacterium cereale]MQY44562.1 TAXI family TRAP transporter solute-binding subunit [Endobacterium cereale]
MNMRAMGLIALAIVGSIWAPRAGFSAEADRNIMASGGGGTQLAIARDIADLGNKCGMPVNVVGSKGSLENFFGVRNRHNTQFGIVDGDILTYLNSYQGQNSDVRQAIQGMRIMFPLYDAEVHVVAREGIRTLQDLRGKRVGVGEPDSSAYLTSQLIFDILRIQVAERVRGSGNDMVELLRQGEIDALVRVGGAPLALLNDGRIDDSFHLVPITDQVLHASYKNATLPAGIYAFQKTAVQTVSVKTLLMTYEYGTGKNSYYDNACKTVADFTSLIVDNIDELRRSGHQKWKDVNLTEVPKGWEVGMCVRRGLDTNYKVSCTQAAGNAENQQYLNLLQERLKQR